MRHTLNRAIGRVLAACAVALVLAVVSGGCVYKPCDCPCLADGGTDGGGDADDDGGD